MSDDTVHKKHRAVFTSVAPSHAPTSPRPSAPTVQEPTQPQVVTSQSAISAQPAPKKRRRWAILFFLLSLLTISVSVLSFQLYWQSKQKISQLDHASPDVFTKLENKVIIAQVRRHMMLPKEDPLVDSVEKAASVRQEPFYANAEDGDKVLVFARRAILYRPSIDKIIEIGYIRPISPTPEMQVQAQATSSSEPVVAGVATSSAHILFQNEKK